MQIEVWRPGAQVPTSSLFSIHHCLQLLLLLWPHIISCYCGRVETMQGVNTRYKTPRYAYVSMYCFGGYYLIYKKAC